MTAGIDLKHALVALDQSQASEVMVECLSKFEQFGTHKFTLFTSVSVPYPGGLSSGSEEQYREQMREYEKRLEPLNIDIETDIQFKVNGYVPSEILNAAKEHNTDYIIIANRGHNKFRELLLGSTVTELLQRCELPVYLINLSVTDEEALDQRKLYCVKSCADSLKRILHPTDFSPTANRAFEQLCELAPEKTEQISLLHVQASGRKGVDDPEQLEKFDAEDHEKLTEYKKRLEKLTDAEIIISINYGSPTAKILAEAEERSSTMIMLGSQGRGYVEDLFIGGVSLNVIRQSKIPVLTIPANRYPEDK
ncbi:MAG: universal stress protein [Balneolaceae bacterium]|nr:universal stress protein [Balneolaceae bacterium]